MGYYWETSTELFHVRNRVYLTSLGTWIQRDPVGYSDSTNLYQYVSSNPINASDPTGLFGPLAGCIAGAVIGGVGSLIYDWWNDELTACESTVQALLSGLLGCLSGAILINPVLAGRIFMDFLVERLGLTTIGHWLWAGPGWWTRTIGAWTAGASIANLQWFVGDWAKELCNPCNKGNRRNEKGRFDGIGRFPDDFPTPRGGQNPHGPVIIPVGGTTTPPPGGPVIFE